MMIRFIPILLLTVGLLAQTVWEDHSRAVALSSPPHSVSRALA
jgi:hypothetical protein